MNPKHSQAQPPMSPSMRSLFVVVLGAAFLTACPKPVEPEPVPAAPQIVSFTASQKQVASGGSVTLSWQTKDATKIELRDANKGLVSGVDSSKLNGSVDVAITEQSLFVLSVENARGVRESAAVAVAVEEGATELMFVASPSKVNAGEPVTLAWTAPGAQSVSLTDGSGASVELNGQVETGAVTVRPTSDETYQLKADARSLDQAVQVMPVVRVVSASPSSGVPGEKVTVSWQTAGAQKVAVALAGTGELYTETDAAKVADGSFEYTVPLTTDLAAALTFIVTAERQDGAASAAGQTVVWMAGTPKVRELVAPGYGLLGGSFTVSWKTSGADYVQVLRDGAAVYQSPDLASANQGQVELPTGTAATVLQLRAVSQRGGLDLSQELTVEPVGKPTVVDFTASPGVIAQGGMPATLSWNVPNARELTITANGTQTVVHLTGTAAEMGTFDTYPNEHTDYVLTASNTIGDAVPPQTQSVEVTTPAQLQFSPQKAPLGAQVQLTGSTLMNGGTMHAWNFAVKNDAADAFVDISTTGTEVPFTANVDTQSVVAMFPSPFTTTLLGTPISTKGVNISINGWLTLTETVNSGPGTPPSTFPNTSYPPLTIAPWGDDLQGATNTHVYWQLDGSGPTERLIVQWNDVRPYGSSAKLATFQAQVYANGEIVFAYQSVTGMTSSDDVVVGVQNAAQSAAVAANKLQFADGHAPATGDRFHFFGAITPPAPLPVLGTEYEVVQEIANGSIRIKGAPDLYASGQFWISEVNRNPATGRDPWFEVTNGTNAAIDLADWVVDFGNGLTFTVPQGVVLPANGVLLFGPTPDAAEASAGGPAVDVVYGAGYPIAAASGTLSMSYMQSPPYTQVSWSTAGTQGVSLRADPVRSQVRLASGLTALTCNASSTTPYGASGQLGTPGAVGKWCLGYTLEPAAPNGFQSIFATGAVVGTLSGSNTDSVVGTLTLARPVKIFGAMYSALSVSSNGFVATVPTSSSATSNDSTPSNTAPNGTLAPFWDDLVGNSSSSAVVWQQFDPDGTPGTGDEYTLISWENWKRYGYTGSLNFQIKFVEGTGDIEFHYGTMTASTASYAKGGDATTWIENETGTAAIAANVNSSSSPGIQPNTGFRFVAH